MEVDVDVEDMRLRENVRRDNWVEKVDMRTLPGTLVRRVHALPDRHGIDTESDMVIGDRRA